MKKSLLTIAIAMMAAAPAMADQCAAVTMEQALEAKKLISESGKIKELCEPCGETVAQESKVTSVDVEAFGSTINPGSTVATVLVNGKGIDLAYTFVEGLNLATLVGCDAHGVSQEIK